jgi:hypothetical protein
LAVRPVLLSSLARSHVVVRDDLDLVQARAALDRTEAEFVVVVTADGNPLGVLGEQEMRDLGDSQGALTSLADRFPGLVVVGAEPDEFDLDELLELAELLGREGLRFVLVERDGQPAGVVPRAAIADALPLDLLDIGGVRSGNPDVPALRYVCRKCAPPSYQLPRVPGQDGQPPTCRRVFFHGPMEPDA